MISSRPSPHARSLNCIHEARHPSLLAGCLLLGALLGACGDESLSPSGEPENSEEATGDSHNAVRSSVQSLQDLSPRGCENGQGLEPKAPWAMVGGCPNRAGRSALTGSLFAASNWRTDLRGDVRSSPVVSANGTTFVASNDDRLFALNDSGEVLWEVDLMDPLPWWIPRIPWPVSASPAIGQDGTVYIGSDHSRVQAFHPATGAQSWSFSTGAEIRSPLAIGPDGTIYVGTRNGKVFAINKNGTQRWSYTLPTLWPFRDVRTAPAIDLQGNVYFTVSGKLVSLNAAGGLRFVTLLNLCLKDVVSSPTVSNDGVVYVGGGTNTLYAINATNGSIRWTRELGGILLGVLDDAGSPAIGKDGTIYVGSTDSHIYAHAPDGTFRWKYRVTGPIRSTPLVDASEHVFVGSDDNYVYAFDGANGQRLWRFNTGHDVRSSVALGTRGQVLVGSDDNHLYSIGEGTAADLSKLNAVRDSHKDWLGAQKESDDPSTPAQLAAAAAAQADMSTAAAGFLEGTFSLDDYIAVSRDRSDKVHEIFVNPQLAEAIKNGDGDRDLVPDTIDQCPNTPPLTPTDAVGCTEAAEEHYTAEKQEEIRKDVLDDTYFSFIVNNPTCQALQVAQEPTLITQIYANNAIIRLTYDGIFFWFKRTACPARLVIQVDTENPSGFSNGAKTLTFEISPQRQVNAINSNTGEVVAGATGAVIDASHGADYTVLTEAMDPASPYLLRARAMAVHGNGLVSDWSPWLYLDVWDLR